MPNARARHRGIGILDPRVGMSRRRSSRNPSVAGSATRGPRCFFRHARTCSIAVRFRFFGGSGCMRLVIRGFPAHRSGRGSDRGPSPAPPRPCPPAVMPGLVPGIHVLSGAALARLSWTPEQVRGDKRGAETVPFVGIQTVSMLNRTAVALFRASTTCGIRRCGPVCGRGNEKGRRNLRRPHFSTLANIPRNASRVKQKMPVQGKQVDKPRISRGFFFLPIRPPIPPHAIPLSPLPHCAKYGAILVPSQGYFLF